MLLSLHQIHSTMKSLVPDRSVGRKPERRGNSLETGTILNGSYRIEAPIEQDGAGDLYTVTLVRSGEICPLCHRKVEGTHNLFCSHFGVKLNGQIFQMEVFPGHMDRGLIRKLLEISHPHIARIYDTFSLGCNTHVVSEYVPGATLNRSEGVLTAEQIRMIGICLTETIRFLHSRGIYHINLQADNLKLAGDSPRLISLSTCRPRNTLSGQDLERSERDDYKELLETLEKLMAEYGDQNQGNMICRLLVAFEEMIERDELSARSIQETLAHS
jgi:hypothetical protein